MILVDTSIWIDHFRERDDILIVLLESAKVLMHPFVIGEIALGTLRTREQVLSELFGLPQAKVATDEEVLRMIERYRLFGQGIGYVDAHLLAAVRLTHGTTLWTRDRRLRNASNQLGLTTGFLR